MRQPEIIAGARGPIDVRQSMQTAGESRRGAGLAAIPSGKVVFQSKWTKYRLQLTAPEEHKLSDGRIKRDKAIAVQFIENFAILDEKTDTKTIEMMREHAQFGNDFWDFSTVLEGIKVQKVKDAVATLADPAFKAAIIEALQAEGVDFELSGTKTEKAGAASKPVEAK